MALALASRSPFSAAVTLLFDDGERVIVRLGRIRVTVLDHDDSASARSLIEILKIACRSRCGCRFARSIDTISTVIVEEAASCRFLSDLPTRLRDVFVA